MRSRGLGRAASGRGLRLRPARRGRGSAGAKFEAGAGGAEAGSARCFRAWGSLGPAGCGPLRDLRAAAWRRAIRRGDPADPGVPPPAQASRAGPPRAIPRADGRAALGSAGHGGARRFCAIILCGPQRLRAPCPAPSKVRRREPSHLWGQRLRLGIEGPPDPRTNERTERRRRGAGESESAQETPPPRPPGGPAPAPAAAQTRKSGFPRSRRGLARPSRACSLSPAGSARSSSAWFGCAVPSVAHGGPGDPTELCPER